ncbi:MAG: glycosyltransferase family 39 protein, partial [Cyanobacteria bacterium P01_A01_bin.114]
FFGARKMFRKLSVTNTTLLVILIALVLGLLFRFSHINKPYTHDEAYTSLRISGYPLQTLLEQEFDMDGEILTVQDLQVYQTVNPDKTLIDTIAGLADEEPQLPPLYFILAKLWAQIFGSSIISVRNLSVFISLLSMLAFYRLCQDLFEAPQVKWFGLALMAVSPFQVLYAHNARPYGLEMLLLLVASVSLLKAIRVNTWKTWLIYTLAVTAGLYTHLFFIFVVAAHGLYLLIIERFRWGNRCLGYLFSLASSCVMFAPWLVILGLNVATAQKMTASATASVSVTTLVRSWLRIVGYTFLDLNFEPYFVSFQHLSLRLNLLLIPGVILLIAYALFVLVKEAPKPAIFVITLIGVSTLPLMGADLFLGSKLSVRARYLIPLYPGLHLAVAYLLATRLSGRAPIGRRVAKAAFALVLTCGVVSCTLISVASGWWHTDGLLPHQIAAIVNDSERPLVIANNDMLNVGDILALSHELDNNVTLQLVSLNGMPTVPSGFQDIFLFPCKAEFRAEIAQGQSFAIEPVPELGKYEESLFRLKAAEPLSPLSPDD